MTLELVVCDVQDETDKIRLIALCAQDKSALPAYTAGSHIDVDLGDLGTRSYSLIDWPKSENPDPNYTIAVQREDGGTGGSKAMHALQPGQNVSVSSPTNDFELGDSSNPVVLVAGGIGVTPLISMATELKARNQAFAFHYAGRSRSLMGFTERLQTELPDHLTLHCDDETPINLASLMANQRPGTHVYICGPKGMIDATLTAARAAGIADQNIHIELFSAPEAQLNDTPFEVEIHGTGGVHVVPVGKTIIEVLEEAGVDIMFDCQRGDCGICQTDVISGIPDHRDVVLSEADRVAGNVMQICVSRAKSERLVLDI